VFVSRIGIADTEKKCMNTILFFLGDLAVFLIL